MMPDIVQIKNNICIILNCELCDIQDFRKIDEGLMNISYVFSVNDIKYIYRHAGEGTEELINRKNEKKSLLIAKENNIDSTFIYMDDIEGYKISFYKDDYRKPDYYSENDSDKVIKLLKKLHSLDIKTNYEFNPFEDSLFLLDKIKKIDDMVFKECEQYKNRIFEIYNKIYNKNKCFCHCDFYRPNILIKNDDIILIDWEYSAMSNPFVDVAYYIVDAMYDFESAKSFIIKYLRTFGLTRKPLGFCIKVRKDFHDLFFYIPIVAYYWVIWAIYKKLCGFDVDDYLEKWKKVMTNYLEYIEYYISKYGT